MGYFIDVRNLQEFVKESFLSLVCCNMKFDYVHISLTHEKYWYEIGDVLVPIIHAM